MATAAQRDHPLYDARHTVKADAGRGDVKGICRLTFDEDGPLRRRFPNAKIMPADTAMASLISVLQTIECHRRCPIADRRSRHCLPEAVWSELRKIPAGKPESADIAAAVGRPGTTRLSACQRLEPGRGARACRRVISQTDVGSYAGGLDRKRKLLATEGVRTAPAFDL